MSASKIVTLQDPQSGSRAQVFVGFGFNCFQFQVRFGQEELDVIWAEDDFASGNERPSGSGIPLLFPFPGRIGGTVLEWEGKQYQLQPGDGRGNAIHGFVNSRPWRIVDQAPHSVRGQFQASLDDPSILQHWPADFRLTVDYRLESNSLISEIVVQNPGQQPLPWGLGLHPYFRTPLGGANAGDCLLQLPIRRRWESIDMLPTGKLLAEDRADQFQRGAPLASLFLDDVFTDLLFQNRQAVASLTDPNSGRRVEVRFDDTFGNCVAYIPAHRQAICIEPYSCAPDAFRLRQMGIDAGLRVLAPGESFQVGWSIHVL